MRCKGIPIAVPADQLTQDQVDGIQHSVTPISESNPVVSQADLPGNIIAVEEFAVGTTSVQSTNNIPKDAVLVRLSVNITTPYTAGGTMQIGTSGTANFIISTTDINITVASFERYDLSALTWPADGKIYVTIGGTPVAGASKIRLEYY